MYFDQIDVVSGLSAIQCDENASDAQISYERQSGGVYNMISCIKVVGL